MLCNRLRKPLLQWIAQRGYEIVERRSALPASLIIRACNSAGEPVELETFYITDRQGKPRWCEFRRLEPGRYALAYPKAEPFEIHALWPVDGFGRVCLTADNEGEGYSLAGQAEIDLATELAKTKVRTVVNSYELLRGSGGLSENAERLIREMESALGDGNPYEALAHGLWVGEDLELTKARQQLAAASPERRRRFLFGCNAFGFETTPSYREHFVNAFNYATLPFYWARVEPIEGQPDWDTRDRLCKWLSENGIQGKGHPLAWAHPAGIPKWLRRRSYSTLKEAMANRVYDVVRRYRDRIKIWDVINEAHDCPWANPEWLTTEQQADLTLAVCQAARAADPKATLVVNVCAPWGEYCGWFESRDPVSPLEYLKKAIEQGADFDVVGVQMYYGAGPHHLCRDMTEISLMLDRYGSLGKPVHVTELGTPSDWQEDVRSWSEASPILAAGVWHKPWDEATQADWVEQYYTIVASKPYVEAITWWDLSDRSKFWPHGGFLRHNDEPKQSYHRLRSFIKAFREGAF